VTTAAPAAILAFDLDGTLFDARGEAAPGIVHALRDLAHAGVGLVPCTGRPLHGALKAAATLDVAPAACVAYHGAVVVDLLSGEWIRHLSLPDELATRLVRDVLAAGLDVSLYVGDERLDLDAGWLPPSGGIAGVTRLVLAGDPLHVSSGMPPLDEARRTGLRIEHVRPGVVVVLPGGADKGDGLRLVAEHLAVPPARIVACGDTVNDITLLLAAGHAVAVGEAAPELRRVAGVTVAQAQLAATLRALFARLG
jgi:hydroxymethylpyrimidine pyrophosphatase-like HAD family hydrolase